MVKIDTYVYINIKKNRWAIAWEIFAITAWSLWNNRNSVESTCLPQQQLGFKLIACTSHQDRLPSCAAQNAPHHQGRVQLGATETPQH